MIQIYTSIGIHIWFCQILQYLDTGFQDIYKEKKKKKKNHNPYTPQYSTSMEKKKQTTPPHNVQKIQF